MIGIIDSGFGGLSVVKEMIAQGKGDSFVYLGDNMRAPYGTKNVATIQKYAIEMVDYLVTHFQINQLVIACNTIVASALTLIETTFPHLQIENIVLNGAVGALQSFNQHVSVLATNRTVDSKIYSNLIQTMDEEIMVTEVAASELVPMVELGKLQSDKIDKIVKAIPPSADVLILGCTHFPFLYEEIRSRLPNDMQIIDPAYSCVRQMFIDEKSGKKKDRVYLTTGEEEDFTRFLQTCEIYENDLVEKIQLGEDV